MDEEKINHYDNENEYKSKSPYNDIAIDGHSKENLTERDELNYEEEPQEKKSYSQLWKEYPKCVFCIVGNEFCERFSYYGMRAILVLYLVNILNYTQDQSSTIYHAFICVCYFSPILGSILADGYIGKYYTIMWVSLFYASGNIILSVAAAFAPGHSVHPALDFVGLLVIGLGTGGIKPCVSAFGGDQFKKGQEKQLESFFSVFYFSINAGSLISTILTPILRTRPCLGEDTCYSLAFGVPAILMIVAVIFFAAGTPFYKRYKAKDNVLAEFARVIYVALKNKYTFNIKRDTWVEHYLDDHTCKYDPKCIELGRCQKESFIKDVHAVLRVFVMYVPLPFFWMLYDQQGDRWTLQACYMNGKMGNIAVLPDQMGFLNTVMIMAFIPLFDGIIYPLSAKCFKVTYLRKMCAGGFLASLSFVVCALVQWKLNDTMPQLPPSGQAYIQPINYAGCLFNATATGVNGPFFVANQPTNTTLTTDAVTREIVSSIPSSDVDFQIGPNNCSYQLENINFPINAGDSVLVSISKYNTTYTNADLAKSTQGLGYFKIGVVYAASNDNDFWSYNDNDNITGPNGVLTHIDFAWCLTSYKSDFNYTDGGKLDGTCNSKNAGQFATFQSFLPGGSNFVELAPTVTKDGQEQFYYLFVRKEPQVGDPKDQYNYVNTNITTQSISEQGGIYLLTILEANDTTKIMTGSMYEVASPNTLSIWWQVPQYTVISAAEILFSITGLVFSFTQAPLTMKSVIMAAWLVTDAVGNLLIIIFVAALDFNNEVYLYVLFAAIMFVVMIIFVLMSVFYYDYVEYIFSGTENTDKKDKKEKT